MEILLPKLRWLKHEKGCKTKIVTRTPSSGISRPNFHDRLHLEHSSWKKQKTSSSGERLHENCRNEFSKTCINFGRCYGNQGWAEAVEKYIFLKIRSFKGSVEKSRHERHFAHCSLILYFIDFKFSKFVCPSELHLLVWCFFIDSFRKKKKPEKPPKMP